MLTCARRSNPGRFRSCAVALLAGIVLAGVTLSAGAETVQRPVPAPPARSMYDFADGSLVHAKTSTTRPTTQPSGPGLAAYRISISYEKAVAQFEKFPTTRPALVGGTVFIGSSSFTKWKTLEKDMAAYHAVNCGFGGSRTDDVLYYARRILRPLHPSRIVYYCGGNDVAASRPADVVVENFKSFVALARQEFPGVPVYFISQNVVPKRVKFSDVCDRVNTAVADWAASTSDVFFISAQDGLLDASGNPRAEYYVKDGVHLNGNGYKIWQANIEKVLRTVLHASPAQPGSPRVD